MLSVSRYSLEYLHGLVLLPGNKVHLVVNVCRELPRQTPSGLPSTTEVCIFFLGEEFASTVSLLWPR